MRSSSDAGSSVADRPEGGGPASRNIPPKVQPRQETSARTASRDAGRKLAALGPAAESLWGPRAPAARDRGQGSIAGWRKVYTSEPRSDPPFNLRPAPRGYVQQTAGKRLFLLRGCSAIDAAQRELPTARAAVVRKAVCDFLKHQGVADRPAKPVKTAQDLEARPCAAATKSGSPTWAPRSSVAESGRQEVEGAGHRDWCDALAGNRNVRRPSHFPHQLVDKMAATAWLR